MKKYVALKDRVNSYMLLNKPNDTIYIEYNLDNNKLALVDSFNKIRIPLNESVSGSVISGETVDLTQIYNQIATLSASVSAKVEHTYVDNQISTLSTLKADQSYVDTQLGNINAILEEIVK